MQKLQNFKVRVHLSSEKNESFHFDIIPNSTPIAQKWVKALIDLLKQNLELEKNFCWMGFPDTPRQLSVLCESLNFFSAQVNKFSDAGGWKQTYQIAEVFNPESILQGGELNHDIMNRIHHHFEVLQGQVWNVSNWFAEADNATRFAIRQLNNLCHEIESLVKAQRMQARYPELVKPSTLITFLNAGRFDLEPEDYEHFTLNRSGTGKVFMRYCQTGKTHYEAYLDGDEHIDRSNINGLRYYSGEFGIVWGQEDSHLPHVMKQKEGYLQWLKKHGYDIDDKSLGHGWLEIAQVDLAAFQFLSDKKVSTLHRFLSNHLNICKIEVLGNEKVLAACEYASNWNQPGYLEQQQKELAKAYLAKRD